MMARKSQRVWVRSTSFSKTAVGTTVDTAGVEGVRDRSSVLTAGGLVTTLDSEFTVVRLIGHYSCEDLNTNVGVLTNPPPFFIGARVAGTEELEELAADANFRSESSPFADPMADWHTWVPAYPNNATLFASPVELFVGKGMFDIRSARRVDGRREDFAVFLSTGAVAIDASITRSVRLSWAALCVVQ